MSPTYRAAPFALPEGVEAEALAALWMAELQVPAMDAEDLVANNWAADRLAAGDPDPGRMFSSYNLPNSKLWIITDDPAGDPITTALLPEDY